VREPDVKDRDPEDDLVYGAGLHIYPGASMARFELQELNPYVEVVCYR